MPRPAASATAPTRRTRDSPPCTDWSRRSSRPCCCTGTCSATTPRPRSGNWAARRSGTSPGGTCSTSGRPAGPRSSFLACPVHGDTGFPRADVENDFLRARRHQVLARIANRLRREPDDVNLILPFDEVVTALGWRGERSLGLQTIRLDTVVGSVDSLRDFDRKFRPTTSRVRERWERLALAQRRGESIPPIDVYRIGDLHFVQDGHHRVSIALATGQKVIDAYVTEVRTDTCRGPCRPRLPRASATAATCWSRATSGCSGPGCPCPRTPTPRSPAPTRGRTPSSARTSRRGDSGACRTSTVSWTGPRSRAGGSPRNTGRSCACWPPPT